MVQVIGPGGPKKTTIGQKLNQGIGRGLEIGGQLMQQHQQKQQMQAENEAVKRIGGDISGINNPKLREIALGEQLRGKSKENKSDFENQEQQKQYNDIKQYMGPEVADLYSSATEGGKTEIYKQFLENLNRETDLGEKIRKQMPSKIKEENENIPIKTQDFDKGLTPKERAARQNQRYSTNLPLYQESEKKLLSGEADKEGLNILEELSPQIGTIERLNINPQSGDLIIPALASPEAQRYVKTINDFTRNAKDSYGARVTNFDITQFMKRLPGLANSQEGRRQIIKQLQIINDINLAREKALHDVIDQHGGIRNIDFDKAEELARKKSEKEISNLRGQFKSIGKSIDNSYKIEVDRYKKNAPKDQVLIRTKDGQLGYIHKDKLSDFLNDEAGEAL